MSRSGQFRDTRALLIAQHAYKVLLITSAIASFLEFLETYPDDGKRYELVNGARVDYLAVGTTRYIGSPKTPTISIYASEDEEYKLQQFRGGDRPWTTTVVA